MPNHVIAFDPTDDNDVRTFELDAGTSVGAQFRYEIRNPSGARTGSAFASLQDAVDECRDLNTGQPASWYVVVPTIHANP